MDLININSKKAKSLLPQELKEMINKKINRINKVETSVSRLEKKYSKLGNKKKVNYKSLRKTNVKKMHLESKKQSLKREIIVLNKGNVVKENTFMMLKRKFRQVPYKKQKQIFGFIFLVPWIIGMVLFFSFPMGSTIFWSLNEMAPKPGGGFTYIFAGLDNYISLFISETLAGTTVLEVLTSSVIDILIDLPTIIIFSIFIAVLLNTKFKGHQIVKAIFFIPVVYNMTVINNTLSGTFGQFLGSGLEGGFVLSEVFSSFLLQVGIGGGLIEFLTDAVDRIFMIVNKSFLTG